MTGSPGAAGPGAFLPGPSMSRTTTASFLAGILLHAALAAPLLARPVLTGALFDAAGAPLPGAQVELLPVPGNFEAGRLRLEGRDLPPPVTTVRGDVHGRFRLEAPRPGVWKLVVRAAGTVPLQYGPVLLLEDEELPPALLPADAALRVRVVLDGGQPAQGAWVLAETADGSRRAAGWRPELRVGRTAADGTLSLPRRSGERLRVSAFPSGQSVDVDPSLPEAAIRLRPPGPARRLQVVAPDSTPVAGVLVRAGDQSWPAGLTAADGTVSLPGGVTSLRLVTPDGRQQVAVLPESRKLTLAPAVQVAGRVLDAATGRGLPDAALWLDTDPAVVLRTDREGRYSLAASAEGTVAFEVRAPGFLPKRLTVSRAEVVRGRAPSLALDRAAVIRGTVSGPDGKPLPGASVVAVHVPQLGPRTFSPLDPVADRAATGPDGGFELRRLQAGNEYEIRSARTGCFPAALTAVAPAAALRVRMLPACGVHGLVRDAEGQAVTGATVFLRPARRPGRSGPTGDGPRPAVSDPEVSAVESGAAGRFSLPQSPAAEVDLDVHKAGYAPAQRRGIRLGPSCGASFDLGAVVLQPGARLAGRVVDPRGRPVAGAGIFLAERLPSRQSWEQTLRGEPDAESGRDGSFAVDDLARGVPLHLLVKADGYIAAAVRGVRPPVRGPLLVRLEPAAVLHGRLLDEAGNPVAGARVNLTWQEVLADDPRERPVGEAIERSSVSKADGRFEIVNVPAGEVSLDVRAQGFLPIEGFEAAVPAPDPERELVLRLRRGARLEGRVTTTAAMPVAGVRIVTEGNSASTDAEGVYAIEGVAPGRQEVRVFHPHYRRRVRSLLIEEGTNRFDVELEEGFQVSGRVVDPDGRPVAGARVRLTTLSRAELREHERLTGVDGGFVLSPVAPDRYVLEASASGFAAVKRPQPLVVVDGPVEGIEIVLRRGATVSGKVLGLSAEELAAVAVTAQDEEGETRPAALDSDGRYEVRNLPPGDWLLRASLWQGQRQVEARVPIAPEERQVVRNLEFSRRVTLSGRVLFEEEPLAGSRVSVRGERFAVERSVTCSFDGSFVLQDLEPDRYWLGVNDPQRLLAHNDTLDVQEDREVTVRIEAATLAGRVEEAGSGEAIPEATLILRPAAGTDFQMVDGSLADGSFRILHIPPGSYRLTVLAKGYASSEREILLAAGEEVSGLDLQLSPTAGLEINVRLASGKVPPLVHVQARSAQGAPVFAASYPTAASGSVELASLPAGTWQLVVGAAGGAAVTETVTVPGEPRQIVLPAAGSLHVRIPELASQNLLATLRLLGQGQQPFWTLGFGGSVEQSWTVRGGKATVEGVPAGQWLVVAEAANGRVWQGTVATSGTGEVAVSLE